jgi:hypothetical protein
MPNRILKESICTSENVDQLTPFQETFFYRLMVNCDDYGRMDARTKILSSRLFPLKEVKSNQIEDAIRALVAADLVILYEVDGKPYLQMKTWDKHQQVRAKKSKYPSPDEGICNQMISNDIKCPRNPIQSNTNPNPNTKGVKKFTPPTVEEVAAYCKERGNGIDAEYFVAYYAKQDWMLSNGRKMSDWKMAVITWERRDKKPAKTVVAQQYSQREYSGVQDQIMADQEREIMEFLKRGTG